jgi:hypothetical protein
MAASSNRVGIHHVKEVTWGTNPSTDMQAVNYTNQSFTFNIENITSNSIRSDRQVSDLIQTGADCSGGFEFELQYGGYDELLAASMFSDWVGVGGTTTETITAAASTEDFTFSTDTLTFGAGVTHDIVEGQYVRLKNCTTSGNDGDYKVAGVTGQALTLTGVTGTDVETSTTTVSGSRLRNGTTMSSFTFERSHLDMTPTQFFQYAGMVPNTMSLDFSSASVLTGSMDFVGKAATITQSTANGGSLLPAVTTDFMNAVANVGDVKMDGTAVSACLTQQITLEVNNNVRGLSSIGQLGFCDVVEGEVGVTGSINMYFKDNTIYDDFIAATAFELDIDVSDNAGNTYVFTMPKCKLSTDEIATGGKNSDVMENAAYQAILKTVDSEDYTVQICRLPA